MTSSRTCAHKLKHRFVLDAGELSTGLLTTPSGYGSKILSFVGNAPWVLHSEPATYAPATPEDPPGFHVSPVRNEHLVLQNCSGREVAGGEGASDQLGGILENKKVRIDFGVFA